MAITQGFMNLPRWLSLDLRHYLNNLTPHQSCPVTNVEDSKKIPPDEAVKRFLSRVSSNGRNRSSDGYILATGSDAAPIVHPFLTLPC